MAKFSLIPFDSRTQPDIMINCELTNTNETLFISYKMTGDLASINLGDGSSLHGRVIGLWNKTCFELFLKNKKDQYFEFNFSPTFEWNAFYFEKKGDPLTEYAAQDKIVINVLHSLENFTLIAEIDKRHMPKDFFTSEISVGITSVIKDKKDSMSYWALSHADQKPNFHHFESFKCKF
ncbi:MAG: hypothetical protein HOP07_02545 [Bacteriovoracaceae bacterium]|nr:hypothetical protein [Bacteriovoracaceae bacterium]